MKIIIALLGLLLGNLLRLTAQTPAQNMPIIEEVAPKPAEYDSVLAQKLGADEHGMKRYVLVLLKTGPAEITEKTVVDSLFAGHMANIGRLANGGKLAVAGPIGKKEKYRGLFILNTKAIDEAREMTETDPAIKSGLLEAEFMPFFSSAALMIVNETHGHIQKTKF